MSMDMWTELVSRSAYVLMSSVEVGSAERGEVNQRSCFWEVWRGVHLLFMNVATIAVVRSCMGVFSVAERSCRL